MPSIKLPLKETAKVTSIKLPLKEKVWLLVGFILEERVIEWKRVEFTIIENIKSRISVDAQLQDKNNLKLKWFGDPVPKLQVFKRLPGEAWDDTPTIEVPWEPNELLLPIDPNSWEIKIVGINDTGEADVCIIGQHQEYTVDTIYEMPKNEKYFFFDVEVKSEYRFEVNV